jgi:AbrB family looped-hinge helix DNA binding protein
MSTNRYTAPTGDITVPLVKIKERSQVTLPASVRAKIGVGVGDLLEAEVKVKGKKITLTPKIVVDRTLIERRLTEGLDDLKAGRTYGPFTSARDAVRSLHREVKRLQKR